MQQRGMKMLVSIVAALAVICAFSVAGAQQTGQTGQTGYMTERGQQQYGQQQQQPRQYQFGQQDQYRQQQQPRQYGQQDQLRQQQQLGQQEEPLVGREVRDQTGENIGSVDNVVTSPDGEVQVIVSHGGWLGIGSREVAISMQDLQIPPQADYVIFQGTEQQLENMPEYQEPERTAEYGREQDRWGGGPGRYGPYGYYPPAYPPDRGFDTRGQGRMGSRWDEGATRERAPMGQQWDRSRQFNGRQQMGQMDRQQMMQQPQRQIQEEQVRGETALRMTDVIGQQITTQQGQQIGTVDDVVVTVDGGKAFAIIEQQQPGQQQQRGQQQQQNLVAIPFENLDIQQGRLLTSMSQQELQRQRQFTYESGYDQQRLHRFQARQQQQPGQQQQQQYGDQQQRAQQQRGQQQSGQQQ